MSGDTLMSQKMGSWAFLIGVVVAIVLGFVGGALGTNIMAWGTLLLVVLGLLVGFLNVKDKEIKEFLIASIALILTGSIGSTLVPLDTLVPTLGTLLQAVMAQIAVFVTPAALVVAIKAIYNLAGGSAMPKMM